MKTIGLIGGMSWESTQTYYRLINQRVRDELGGLHSARLVLYSVDFAEIEALQHQGDWDATAEILSSAGQSVEAAGAEFIVLCTNTMHKVASQIEQAVSIPLLHIADATAMALKRDGITCVGLLGTRFTMEQTFYLFNLGMPKLKNGYPDFNRHIGNNDWAAAARESRRHGISDERNLYVRTLLNQAARNP